MGNIPAQPHFTEIPPAAFHPMRLSVRDSFGYSCRALPLFCNKQFTTDFLICQADKAIFYLLYKLHVVVLKDLYRIFGILHTDNYIRSSGGLAHYRIKVIDIYSVVVYYIHYLI